MVIVAAEQHETLPLLVDPWAARLLPPAVRLAAASTRWAPLRGAIIAAAEKKIPGIWAAIACRKRYIDDRLLAAFDEGIDAVLILGAGFDSRACRLPQLAHIPVWEVDLPDNIAAKSKALQRCFGSPPDNIRLTAVDFETDDLADAFPAIPHAGPWLRRVSPAQAHTAMGQTPGCVSSRRLAGQESCAARQEAQKGIE